MVIRPPCGPGGAITACFASSGWDVAMSVALGRSLLRVGVDTMLVHHMLGVGRRADPTDRPSGNCGGQHCDTADLAQVCGHIHFSFASVFLSTHEKLGEAYLDALCARRETAGKADRQKRSPSHRITCGRGPQERMRCEQTTGAVSLQSEGIENASRQSAMQCSDAEANSVGRLKDQSSRWTAGASIATA